MRSRLPQISKAINKGDGSGSTLATQNSNTVPSTTSDLPRRRTGANMSVLELRSPQTLPSRPNNLFVDCRLPQQTHDTTSIYIAAQRQQRLQKEPTRRSSTNVPPSKSCLSPSSKSEPSSPSKLKRKVSFADDKGLSLTEVRIMKNEINDLPLWTRKILLESLPITRNENAIIQTWDPLFPQPASDYLAFRRKIEEGYVALENVIVKKDDDLLTGTVKVKNLSYEKHVFVRATFDCWTSQCDYPGIFVQQGLSTLPALFDTFSFSIKVPASAARYGIIEFCVGYQTSSGDFWDSNGGKNYKLALITRRSSEGTNPVPIMPSKINPFVNSNIGDWMDFTSWSQILSQGPYW